MLLSMKAKSQRINMKTGLLPSSSHKLRNGSQEASVLKRPKELPWGTSRYLLSSRRDGKNAKQIKSSDNLTPVWGLSATAAP